MIGEIIGAAASLFAGNKQNQANEKAQAQQYQQQKEFAQSGIQWKVDDAKKAGIHPLYALGANTISYAPQSVGGPDYSAIANAGQNIGRAIDSTRSNPAKTTALLQTGQAIQMEGYRLDNELKKVQLASAMATARQAGSAPGMPTTSTIPSLVGMPGQGDTPHIEPPNINLERKISPTSPGQPHAEYGASPEVSYYRTADGTFVPQIPQALSEPFEQDTVGRWAWNFRNRLHPAFWPQGGYFQPPSNQRLKDHEYWSYTIPHGYKPKSHLSRGHQSWRKTQ